MTEEVDEMVEEVKEVPPSASSTSSTSQSGTMGLLLQLQTVTDQTAAGCRNVKLGVAVSQSATCH